MSPIAGDAAVLLSPQEFSDLMDLATDPEKHLDCVGLARLLQHDTLSRQRILWLERENEELRYHLAQAKNSTHALQRVYPAAKP